MTAHVQNRQERRVSLAVLTHRRPDGLIRAVDSMVERAVPAPNAPWSLHEILVVDNNPDGSAEMLMAGLREGRNVTIRYVHETTPGIVAARNRALAEAGGDVLVFIDDDEVALAGWPAGLLDVMVETGAAMVGGPVVTEFVEPPEQWVLDSGFFDQAPRPDGAAQTWLSTCNVAIDLPKIRAAGLRFDPRYPHGEDATFSMLAASKGLDLRWSATAPVKELVEAERTTLSWRRDRHRISTDAWARAQLDLDPSPRTEAGLLAKSAWRLVQGVAKAAIGAALGRTATRNSGLALVSQAAGGLQGVRRHRAERRAGSTLEP